ncbi:CPBP family intramembrane glutamic endopeptidase [Microbacterium halotolerans]|uniref:CPBP family intramembrane glutamic endopeptidase n=1 Tax=Microbacterium halotolerans TaxID=246613 RepID=UPI000E6AA338|nr:type II CAAX endopeptidase family protein [Microbacterium halotolerans]
MTDTTENDSTRRRDSGIPRVGWGPITVFVLVALALAWAVAIPLWLGPVPPLVGQVIAVAMMFTPALAVLVVTLVMRAPRRGALRFLGMWPLKPVGRTVWFCVIGLFGPLVLTMVGIALSGMLGFVELDLQDLSGFTAQIEAAGADLAGVSPWAIVITQLATVPFVAVVPNAIAAFGEEIGWRGWLTAALRPRGVWPTLLITGVVWGLWHAPLILLGHNYGRTDVSGVLMMVVACVLLGVLFGWLRLRTGSVWPAVFAHGALNSVGQATLLFTAAGTEPDPALIAPMGVPMWIVLAVVIIVLMVTGQFRSDRLTGFVPQHPDAGSSVRSG